jgi:hypothetical protein
LAVAYCRRMSRIAVALGPLAAFALMGCHPDASKAPANRGLGTCVVRLGEAREAVRSRCGPPCFSGVRPKGPCRPDQSFFSTELCSNDCDVYGTVAICTVHSLPTDPVVSVHDMGPSGESTLAVCQW